MLKQILENYIKTKTKTNLVLKQIKKSEKMLWEHGNQTFGPQDVTEHGLGNWQSVVQVQYYMLEVEDHHLAYSDASDTMNF